MYRVGRGRVVFRQESFFGRGKRTILLTPDAEGVKWREGISVNGVMLPSFRGKVSPRRKGLLVVPSYGVTGSSL